MTYSDVLIIGGGLSGLSCAHFLKKYNPALSVLVLEKSDRAGGVIDSCAESGFLAEAGPHGFLDNKPESQEILYDLQLESLLQKAPLADFKRYLCKNGRLMALPQKPGELITSSLLSLPAKLRLLAEPFIKPLVGSPTVSDWAKYRFGKGVLPLVDAAVTGTFSGDFTRLSMDAVMPGVRLLEKESGSLLKGLWAKKKKKAAASPLPSMVNFPDGMVTLVNRLAAETDILFADGVRVVRKKSPGFEVVSEQGIRTCSHLVSGLPINGGLHLLSQFKPPVAQVPESVICNIVLGFKDSGFVPRAFGFLVPECENRFVLGCMFSSAMFPGRAPAGHVLLEVLVGGRRHPERLELDDQELIDRAVADLGGLVDLPGEPVSARVIRPKGGIPQLEKDHVSLLQWRETVQDQQPGLHICGFGWDGIGINDAVKSASQAAMAIINGRQKNDSVAVKPVYF
jgi:oxygen-dependent protoporphyrinogen oxidase